MKQNKVATQMIKNLSKKTGEKNKNRNRIVAIAIVLTTVMMTIVFTTALSLKSYFYQQSLKEIGTFAEASYKSISLDEYETLVQSGWFDDISYTVFVGSGAAPSFSNHVVEFRYTEDKAAKWNFCELSTGHLPREKNEIVIDNLFMEYMGKEYQVGDTISVDLVIAQQTINREFVVSGIFTGNNVLGVSMAYVSYIFAQEEIDNAEISYDGLVDAFCRLDGTEGAYDYLLDAWNQCGLNGVPSIGVNWVLEESGIGGAGVALICVVIVIIIIAGYLMIYNIFYISIVNDMQYYGRLKLIGMQNYQIRKIIVRQVVNICAYSIPIGLLLGWIIGTKSLPVILKLMGISANNIDTFYPFIFVFSFLFVFFTVFVSLRKPLKLLKEIQPMETAKYLGNMNVKKEIHSKGKISIVKFAYRNINRNKKKSGLLILSLTLVMTLFVISSNLVHSVNFEEFFKNAIPNDVYVATSDFFDGGEAELLDEDFVENCCSLPGVRSASKYYMKSSIHFLPTDAMKELEIAYDKDVFKKDEIEEDIEQLLVMPKSSTTENRYYFERQEVDTLDVVEGKIDYDKLLQDDYVIVCNRIGETDGSSIYHAGDKITLYDWNENTSVTKLSDGSFQYDNLGEKEYIVMAVVEAKASIMNYNTGFILNTILPAEKAVDEKDVLLYSIGLNVDDISKTIRQIDKIRNYNGSNISYVTMDEKKQEYTNLKMVFVLLSGGITLVIGLMSIINFLNQCITGVIERKKELSTLHAVGMTDKQMVTMLELENGYLLFVSIIVGYIIGTCVSVIVFKNLNASLKWLVYENAMYPAVILALILIAVIKCSTGKIYHSLMKET